jgi:hypothetical protein
MLAFGQAWKALSGTCKDSWEHFGRTQINAVESQARVSPGAVISPYQGPKHGFNGFLECNMNRYLSDLTPIDNVITVAPIGLPKPEPLLSLSAAQSGKSIVVSWTTITSGPRSDRIEIWLKNIAAKIHPQLIATANVIPAGSITLNYVRGVSGLQITPPPGLYIIQAQVVNSFGLVSTPSEAVYLRVIGDDVFTYFATRQKVLELLAIGGSVGWTSLDLSTYIPTGANSVILYVEAGSIAGVGGNYVIVCARKDSVAGESIKYYHDDVTSIIAGETALMEVKSDRTIEYKVDGPFAGAGTYDIRIYLLGYVK